MFLRSARGDTSTKNPLLKMTEWHGVPIAFNKTASGVWGGGYTVTQSNEANIMPSLLLRFLALVSSKGFTQYTNCVFFQTVFFLGGGGVTPY
jgi:hypothetical protein